MVCLSKGCLLQILFGPFLNTLSSISLDITVPSFIIIGYVWHILVGAASIPVRWQPRKGPSCIRLNAYAKITTKAKKLGPKFFHKKLNFVSYHKVRTLNSFLTRFQLRHDFFSLKKFQYY